MKFARRKPTAPDAAEAPEAPADTLRPPPDAVAVEFAGILDGRSLWVAVAARAGEFGLRHRGSGEVRIVTNHQPPDQPAYLAARLHLDDLLEFSASEGDQARYDVVVVPGTGRDPLPVWTPPLTAAQRPLPSRDAHDVHNQFHLIRSEEGTLGVRRSPGPDAAVLEAISSSRDVVRLTLAGGGAQVALLAEDGEPVATWPTEGDVVRLTAAGLAGLPPGPAQQLVTGEPGSWREIRRRGNGLADPTKGAPMPQFHVEDDSQPSIRLRWGGQARLQLRILPGSTEPSPQDGGA